MGGSCPRGNRETLLVVGAASYVVGLALEATNRPLSDATGGFHGEAGCCPGASGGRITGGVGVTLGAPHEALFRLGLDVPGVLAGWPAAGEEPDTSDGLGD